MILVTGGTGFLGSQLLLDLSNSGASIRAIKRKNSIIPEKLVDCKIEWVEADILDINELEGALNDVDKVYHCAAVVSFDKKDEQKMMQTNVQGTANVVNLVLDKKIDKLMYVSSIAALGRAGNNKAINEDNQWKPHKDNSAYSTSKYLAEMEVWRGVAEGLNALIVNPSVILGTWRWSEGTAKLFKMVKDGLKLYSSGSNGFVGVEDVSKAMILLMQSNISAERFVISSENIAYKQLLFGIADQLGVKRPSIKVTKPMAGIVKSFVKVAGLIPGSKPFITSDTLKTANADFAYENTKIKEQLNFSFSPIEEVIAKTAKELSTSSF